MDTTEGLPRRPLGRYSYPTSHRVIELVGIVVWVVLAAMLASRVITEAAHRWSLGVALALGATLLLAYAVADLASGTVHALCDNLGSEHTPVLGQKFIRSFREHHVDPLDMTRGDFVRVNADNFIVCLPVLVPTLVWVDVAQHLFVGAFSLGLVSLTILTNQIHKWAHLATIGEPIPRVVGALQRRGVLLSPAVHAVHHTPPHASNYCITSGITNPIMNRLWRRHTRKLLNP